MSASADAQSPAGGLPGGVLAAVHRQRDEVAAFAASPGATIDGRHAADAILRLADGAGVDEVARATGQPAWRVRLWATRLAEIGMEAVEAGYWPAEPSFNDVGHFMVGLVFSDSPLTVAGIVSWARTSLPSREMGVDADDDEAWLVWPECAYHFSISADDEDVRHVRKHYFPDVDVPAGVQVKAVMTGVVGDMAEPHVINTGIDVSFFLEEQPGAIVRFAGAGTRDAGVTGSEHSTGPSTAAGASFTPDAVRGTEPPQFIEVRDNRRTVLQPSSNAGAQVTYLTAWRRANTEKDPPSFELFASNERTIGRGFANLLDGAVSAGVVVTVNGTPWPGGGPLL